MRARYEVKRAAGWSDRRQDGSQYDGDVDEHAGEAERWAAGCCGCQADERVYLHGDNGYDFLTQGVRVDVVHLGHNREPLHAHLIINEGNLKLSAADVFLVVGNIQSVWFAVGAITREDFLERAMRKDFGFGEKLALPCKDLDCAHDLVPRFRGRELIELGIWRFEE